MKNTSLFIDSTALKLTSLQPYRRRAEKECLLRLSRAATKEKILNKQANTPNNTSELLTQIKQTLNKTLDTQQWQQFTHEIENQIDNYTLCLWNQENRNKKMNTILKKAGYSSLCQWVAEQSTIQDKTLFFEQWVSKGHPYHPCNKTKLGLSPQETLQYSPEFGGETLVHVGAIHEKNVHIETMETKLPYSNWFFQIFPEIQKKWHYSKEYIPIPIHPWQATHKLQKYFKNLLNSNQLIISNDLGIPTRSTLSFRTVVPISYPQLPHIKLPVAVQTTSAIRTVSPASVENGPKISKILKKILQHENNFNQNIRVMYETAALHVKNFPDEKAKHLSAIFRENPNCYLNKNELGIVVSALFEESPVKQHPIFVELMMQADVTTLNKAKAYFKHYTTIVLSAYLDLYLLYGIALEGHQQNTIAVFKQGKPIAMIARDFGGLRLHLPTLVANGYDIRFYSASAIVDNKKEEVRNKLLHSTYQYHLGEWVKQLARFFKTSENDFWNIVKTATIERFHHLKNRVDQTTWKQEYEAILKKDWHWKALLRMRLENVSHDYIYVPIKNPLT